MANPFSATPIDTGMAMQINTASYLQDTATMAARSLATNRGRMGRSISARYEAADTTSENRRLWDKADALSADGVANPSVRRILRNRTRLACRNNGYLKGMSETISIEVIGVGPQLQMLEEAGDGEGEDSSSETPQYSDFVAWMQRIDLPEKLRLLVKTQDVSGEAIFVQSVDSRGELTYVVYEPDHCQGSMMTDSSPSYYDGIHYNSFGEPEAYDITYSHPGETAIGVMSPNDYRTISAEYVFHLYKVDRPGQKRGVPDFCQAIELLEERRRYRHAVLSAAETVASFASVIEQDLNVVDMGDKVPASNEMEEIELNHRVTTVLPPGHKLGQVKAEQPTTTFNQFDDALLREAGRSVNMPFILVVLTAGNNNLASAYLDLQLWREVVAVRRDNIGRILDWILLAWRKWYGYGSEPVARNVTHVWRWPQNGEHADPSKVANADAAALGCGATTIPAIYSRKGQNYQTAQVQAAKALGLTLAEYRQRLADKLMPRAGQPGSQQPSPAKSAGTEDDEEDAAAE